MSFQVHKPYYMRRYNVFDVGSKHDYFDKKKTKDLFMYAAKNYYVPTNKLLKSLLAKYKDFSLSLNLSGTFLELCEEHSPLLLAGFQELVKTGRVEILAEPYYHSLAFMHDEDEFKEQVKKHRDAVNRLFGVSPAIFRAPGMIYNNELGMLIEKMGYLAAVTEGPEFLLGWRSPNYIYSGKYTKNLRLLLRNHKMSEDLAIRFSSRDWSEWPLTPEKYASWVKGVKGKVLNLFMDYDAFGNHSKQGIHRFMELLIPKVLADKGNDFLMPTEAVDKYSSDGELDIHSYVSWRDQERDITAWKGNKMQESALERLYALGSSVLGSNDETLIADWRNLQASDNIHLMSTKNMGDFNPYGNPYDAFINMMNIFNDVTLRTKGENKPDASAAADVQAL